MYNRGIYALFSLNCTQIMLMEYREIKGNKNKPRGLNDMNGHSLSINIRC